MRRPSLPTLVFIGSLLTAAPFWGAIDDMALPMRDCTDMRAEQMLALHFIIIALAGYLARTDRARIMLLLGMLTATCTETVMLYRPVMGPPKVAAHILAAVFLVVLTAHLTLPEDER